MSRPNPCTHRQAQGLGAKPGHTCCELTVLQCIGGHSSAKISHIKVSYSTEFIEKMVQLHGNILNSVASIVHRIRSVRLAQCPLNCCCSSSTRGLPADLVKTVRQDIWSRFPSKPAVHLLITVSVSSQQVLLRPQVC